MMDEQIASEVMSTNYRNHNLDTSVVEMNEEVECLKQYRDDMLLKKSDLFKGELSVKNSLQELIRMGSNCLIQQQETVTAIFQESDKVYLSCQDKVTPNGTINCLGCGQAFGQFHRGMVPAYHIHCILECDKYKELNLIRNCDKCHKSFMNSYLMKTHVCSRTP